MTSSPPTIGVLYPGEMGAALATVLVSAGARVVTTLRHRSDATATRCRAVGLTALGSLADVAREADVVISAVPPGAAETVAREYLAVAHLAPADALFVDANSVRPELVEALAAQFQRAGRGFVDAAVNGLAKDLASRGTVFLSGARAAEVARLFDGAVAVRVVGPDPGRASAIKMLLSGVSKGTCALVLELAVLAERRGMLAEMLEATAGIYPGIAALFERMLPTYARHAGRRAEEMRELEATARSGAVEPCMIGAVARLHEALARMPLDACGGILSGGPTTADYVRQVALHNGRGGARIVENTRRGDTMADKPRSAAVHPGPGFRVRMNFERLPAQLMRQFREFPTPDISDLLNRLYAVSPAIRPLTAAHHALAGPACTVKTFPGDNLMVHKTLDVAEPGDVVVIDAGGSEMNAVLGDIVCTKAKHRGIAGFIVDGMVRDLPAIAALDFPVFGRGTTPIGPLHRGPGEINYPICCGGVVVNPGDVVVADAAGVVVIPQGIAAELLDRLNDHRQANAAYLESVRRGDFSNEWVDRYLCEQECPVVRGPAPGRAAAVAVEHAPAEVTAVAAAAACGPKPAVL